MVQISEESIMVQISEVTKKAPAMQLCYDDSMDRNSMCFAALEGKI